MTSKAHFFGGCTEGILTSSWINWVWNVLTDRYCKPFKGPFHSAPRPQSFQKQLKLIISSSWLEQIRSQAKLPLTDERPPCLKPGASRVHHVSGLNVPHFTWLLPTLGRSMSLCPQSTVRPHSRCCLPGNRCSPHFFPGHPSACKALLVYRGCVYHMT